ncbi:MAG: hypothetical protein ACKVH8_14500 [Pirellulales bacterium]
MLRSYSSILMMLSLFLASTSLTSAQTVQLPTFRQFGVSTSVLVPTRGSTYLGGIGRNGEYSNSRRGLPFLPGNRGISKSTSHAGMRASAYVHDFDAIDKALLGVDFYRRQKESPGSALNSSKYSSNNSRPSNSQLSNADNLSLSAIKELQVAKNEAANQEANKYLAHAEKALASGKPNIAKLFLRLAIDEAQGEYKQILTARLGLLEKAPLVAGD